MTGSSSLTIDTDRGRSKFDEYRKAYVDALSDRVGRTDGTDLGLACENYYFDALRWPNEAPRNAAKQIAIRALGLPEKQNVEVTTQCVLKCDFCILHSGALSGIRNKTFMRLADFENFFFQVEPFLTHIEFTGGEPLLNYNLPRMVQLCNRHHVKTTIATNAQLLDLKKIDAMLDAPPSVLLVAFEGGDELSYTAHRRGGDFSFIEDGITQLVEMKRKRRQVYPRIQLQTVVSKKTVDQLEHFWAHAEKLGVDSACIKPIFIWPDGPTEYRQRMIDDYLIPDHPLSYHKLTPDGKLKETRVPNYCPNSRTVHIGTGGEIIPCWYNLLSSIPLGNALEEHFVDIWFSKTYSDFRQKMISHTAYAHQCRHCIGIYDEKLFESRHFG
jgi:radical SAM protein with 4Fe4S-binding SPASM domain